MHFNLFKWLERLCLQLRPQRVRNQVLRQRSFARSRYRFLERLEDRTLLTDSPLVSISDASITEGNSGTANLTFTVTRTGDTTAEIEVTYETSNGSATAGSDYAALTGSVVLAAGQTTATIDIPITGDLLVEADETFSVNLTGVNVHDADEFGLRYSFSAPGSVLQVAVADLNGDGKRDVVAIVPGSVAIYVNTTPTGSNLPSFADPQLLSAGVSPSIVVTGDLNGDGSLDLAIATEIPHHLLDFYDVVSVLLNTTAPGSQTVTFAPSVDLILNGEGLGGIDDVELADINRDGKPDVVVSDSFIGVAVWINQTTTGSLTPTLSNEFDFPLSSEVVGLTTADLNADGNLDLVTRRFATPTELAISVLFNTTPAGSETPSFGGLQDVSELPRAIDCAVGDINGDGKPDLAIIQDNSDTMTDVVTILLNTTPPGSSTFSFTGQVDYPLSNAPRTVEFADLNNDGALDLVIATFEFREINILLNQTNPGSLTATFVSAQSLDTPSGPFGAVAGDMNNDSQLDIVSANASGRSFSVFLGGDAIVKLADAQQVAQAPDLAAVIAADFNLDGKLDLAAIDASSQTVVLRGTTLTGATEPTFGNVQPVDGGAQAKYVVTGDFNSDGRPDLAIGNPRAGQGVVTILLNTTTLGATAFSFAQAQEYNAGTSPTGLHVADMNGDGKLDIIVSDPASGSVVVLLNLTVTGSSFPIFDAVEPFDAGTNPDSIVVGDLNGDGTPDVAIANRDAGLVSVLLNTTAAGSATVSFADRKEFSVLPNTHSTRISIGDLNGDSRPDLVVNDIPNMHEPGTSFFTVLVNTTIAGEMVPAFAPSQQIFSGFLSQPPIIVIGDVTGDGLADIVLQDIAAGEQGLEAIAVFPNRTPLGETTLTFADAWNYFVPIAIPTTRHIVDLGLYDFNNNGVLDVVVGVPQSPASFLMSGGPAIADGEGIGTILNDDVPQTPVVDLNGADEAGTANTSSFTEGQGPVNIAQSDATITDTDDTELSNLRLVVSAIFDGASEVITMAGVTFPLNIGKTATATAGGTTFSISYVVATRTFTIVKSGGGNAPIVDFQSALRSVTYNNLSALPNTTPRTISVTGRDPTFTGAPAIATINVTAVNSAPLDLSVVPSTIGENLPSGTIVGTFSTVDPDVTDTFTYSLVAGIGSTDNNSFTIINGQLRSAASFNFETKSSNSIRVRTTDFGGLSFEKQLTISVANTNDPPTDIGLSNSTAPENQPAGTVIGNLSSSDEDLGDTFTYTLVSGAGGADNGFFTTVGNQLRVAAPLDFETKRFYSIRLRTTDQAGAGFEKTFTITATDVNEAPTNITLAPSSLAENLSGGTQVGVLSSTDPDAGATFLYSLVPGAGSTDNASFTINNGQLFALQSFDFEAKSSYAVRIRTTDQGGLTFEKQFTVTVTDANDAPTDLILSPSAFVEGQPIGTVVGDFSAIDPDTGNTFSYDLAAGVGSADNAKFTISNGQLLTATGFDFEAQNSFSIHVRTTDQGGLSFDKVLTVTLLNANEAPTGLSLTPSVIAENQPMGTVVGAFSATDPDPGSIFTYSLVGGIGDTDNSAFNISNGQLVTAASFNFEAQSTYAIRVRATDQGGLSVEKALTITVTNLNEAPTSISVFPMSIAENQPAGSVVGTLSTTDPDAGSTFTYVLVAGIGDTDNGSFTIANGQLRTADSFDFETQDTYSIRVRSTDQGGLSVEKAVLVTINNANEIPVIIADQSFTLAENSALNTIAGTVLSTDPDLTVPFNSKLFGIIGGNPLNAFSIDPATGQLKVNNPAALNFETTPTFQLQISLMDGGGAEAVPATVTVHLSDVNESPVIGPLGPQSLAEDAPNGHAVTTISDPETSASNLTIQVTSSNQSVIPDSGLSFTLSGNSLDLHYVPAADQSGITTLTVTISDGVNTVSRSFDVTVVPENDAPRVSEIPPQTIDEDTPGGPYTVTIDDPDSDIGTLTIAVTSTNQQLIPDSGIVLEGTGTTRTLVITPAANRSGLTVISITVSDGLLSTTQEFEVTVDPVDDPPVIILNEAALTDPRRFHKPVAIDSGAIITDIDTPTLNFSNAVLTVSGAVKRERLMIMKREEISRKKKTVRFNGAVIGTWAGGKKGIPLTITLNPTSSQPAVQSLLRHIRYKSHSTDPERTLQMQVTNIDGIDTNVADRTIVIGN